LFFNRRLYKAKNSVKLSPIINNHSVSAYLLISHNETFTIKEESIPIRVVGPRQWIINNLVAQYSSRIIIKDNNRLIFEAIAFYDDPDQSIQHLCASVDFLVLFGNGTRIFLKVSDAFRMVIIINVGGISRYLWKIKTEIMIDLNLVDFENTFFLLTDRLEYQRMFMTFRHHINSLLTFQKPYIYDSNTKKKQAIAHCVHNVKYMNELKAKQMKAWLTIQQNLGIDWVKLYFLDVGKSIEDDIRNFITNNTGKMKIEIIDFRFEFYVCILIK